MKVMKFGGSSLADAAAIGKAVAIVAEAQQDETAAVVVSALKGVTDQIINIANTACLKNSGYREMLHILRQRHLDVLAQLIVNTGADADDIVNYINEQCSEIHSVIDGVYALGELSLKVQDRIMAFGELCSSMIFTFACNIHNVNAVRRDSRNYIITDDQFGSAIVDFDATGTAFKKLKLKTGEVPVFPGFVARCKDGRVTTLGRDGSDYTAAIIGASLHASVVELWTDVDGVMTANPAYVKDAVPVLQMTFEEAMELSHFGARVIHPPTMHPVTRAGIPLKVRNTFNPDFGGTVISSSGGVHKGAVTGISTLSDVSFVRFEGSGMVGVRGVAGRLFTVLAHAGVNLIMISQGSSEHSICFAVLPSDEKISVSSIADEFDFEISRQVIKPPVVESDKCVLAVVGENMRQQPGIAGTLFSALGAADISVTAIAQGSSERNISIVIDRSAESKALNVIHAAFF